MRKIKKIRLLYFLGLMALGSAVLPSCGESEIEEPAIYTPQQLKRLLLNDAVKTWQQTTEYYLDDSCRIGYRLRFQESISGRIDSAFSAHFIPDASICNAGSGQWVTYRVKIMTSPVYKTTDSLMFISPQSDTIIKTIRLLTNQRLQLNVAGEGGSIARVEEYTAVE